MRSHEAHEIIVIGAGHAGVEAAWAAARMGRDVAICTLSMDTIAHMPCNPAIGGTAKGHLVREIDALGGLMGLAIDATAIQFKLLNRSRGPAVWSPRAQADKRRLQRVGARGARARAEHLLDRRQGGPHPRRGRPRRRAGDGRRRHLSLRRAGGDDRHVPQRPGARRARSAAVGARRRAAVARPRRVAEVVRLFLGPAQDRHSAAPPPAQHRFLAVRRGARRRSAGALLVSERRASIVRRSPVISSTRPTACTRWCASTSRNRRSSTGRSPASARATARRSRTR